MNGIRFQFSLPMLIILKDGPWHGAEAAVVEIDDIRVEQVLVGQMGRGSESDMGRLSYIFKSDSAARNFSA